MESSAYKYYGNILLLQSIISVIILNYFAYISVMKIRRNIKLGELKIAKVLQKKLC